MRLHLLVLRGIMLIIGCGAGLIAAQLLPEVPGRPTNIGLWTIIGGGLAGIVIILDVLYKRKSISTISTIAFGLATGIILAWLMRALILPLTPIPPNFWSAIQVFLICFLCYFAISFIMQTKDDFRFVIPYIEFSRERRGPKPIVLDTSVVIDGRVVDVADSNVLDGVLVIPRFVLQELQYIADSPEKIRRNRGRRGLDVLGRLQKNPRVEVQMLDVPTQEPEDVDNRLVRLSKKLDARLMTNDFNLNKIAQLQGVEVININDLANALRPVVLPGEELRLKVIKPGEEIGQGVGYLDDGTMVVVEQGRPFVGQEVNILITSVLQTSAGKMLFGKLIETQGTPSTGRSSDLR